MQKKLILFIIWSGSLLTTNSCGGVKNSKPIDIDGNVYNTVIIGDQEWTNENIYVSRFNNGDLIVQAKTNEEWEEADDSGIPAWCYYQNMEENGKLYGKLYNWHAVNDSRGLAPEGWHIPNKDEWNELIDFLGGKEIAGSKMKSSNSSSVNDNEGLGSHFNGLLGGLRNASGNFSGIVEHGYWWTSTESSEYHGNQVQLHKNSDETFIFSHYKGHGHSLRFVRD
ncbi:hypothetical protein FF125_08250 [Aureibaculum algae]|uniref:Fibrobacter succinogenes major paralogous domain-containing protein n=1 Tax=Aureibaculum algae TaxID=2584122 RepID=A0A5B7TUU1_9FLAO|nr:fibrobacter succinogenes major paralogous domain-containing protein [Aureibaculum algae]QCX38422.1 hypothetical protein FF125_08250 [Aureibaculum algae]